MAVTSYRFVSPGVQVQEIDESQLPATSNLVGPTIIGRFPKGPANRPVYITSKSQLVETFGNPVPGKSGVDVWRDGNTIGTMYAGYAAQAWLTNTSAVNIVRLLGTQSPNATTDGKAGWQVPNFGTSDSAGGAYGLFVIPSASAGTANVTGTLAAIWYMKEGSVVLSGTLAGTAATYTSGTNTLVQSNAGYGEFHAVITTPGGTYASNFNLNSDSDKFIRRVFNTNPILTNSDVTSPSNLEYYWLGESFERSVDEIIGLSANPFYGFIAPLSTTGSAVTYNNFRAPARPAETGWIIGQDLTTNTGSFVAANQQKLFKFVTLDSGEWAQRELKISISDIKAPPNDFEDYGSFSVMIRKISDSDNNVRVIEQYNNVNLNPVSPNYIAKKIGDKFVEWDDTERRLKEYGSYDNVSSVIRVEMDPDVDNGNVDPTYLPFGFFGPPRPKTFTFFSGSALPSSVVSGSAVRSKNPSGVLLNQGTLNLTASVIFPTMPLRLSASAGAISPVTNAFFGVTTGEKTAYTTFDPSFLDLTRAFSTDFGTDAYDLASGGETYRENSFVFTLDDLSGSTATGVGYVYNAGSRAAGTSKTAVASLTTGSQAGYRAILTAGYDRFTMPLYNGFDGFDIKEADPLRNNLLTSGTPTDTTSYVYYTYNKAIDTISDPEALVTDIVAIPGLTYESLTTKLVQTCEARADALAIIDLPGVYVPEHERYYANRTSRYQGTATTAASELNARALNSSYGATYYPWVQIRDTINDQLVFVPPSVVALGAMSYGQRTQELWFAPAGFTRGGLTEGRGGIPVVGVTQRLTSTDRDTLYEANINPIAQFPAEGIVIFGQKTLQVTPSALDRINVRRLLIYLKREVSRIAATLLFDQNVDVTWSKFLGQVNPFLSSVKSRLGLSEYRVILDNTTTTPDLVDRNILYAKVYLKPARAIEFIAIDFTITSSGASFAD
jgi:hypothetical protein